MRDYIRKSSGIPRSVHMRVRALLADYDRMRRQRADIMYGSAPPPDGMPHAAGAGNPAERRALLIASISSELDAIDQTCMLLRGEYSGKTSEDFDPIRAYWDYNYYNYQHVRTKISPNGPAKRTWYRYKDLLTSLLAIKLNFF